MGISPEPLEVDPPELAFWAARATWLAISLAEEFFEEELEEYWLDPACAELDALPFFDVEFEVDVAGPWAFALPSERV